MVRGMAGWIVCLPYRRTTPDLLLHKTRLHLELSSKERLDGKVRNPDACFTVTVVSRQENKCISTLRRLGSEGTSAHLYVPFLRQYRGSQKCMNGVGRSLWITLLRRKKHPAHGSASRVSAVRAIRGLPQASGYAWLLWYFCCHPQQSVYQECSSGNAVTHIPPS